MIPVLGLGGVLLAAKKAALIIEVKPILARLEHEAGFYLGEDVKSELLRQAGEIIG